MIGLLKILAIYGLPIFNDVERSHYFALTDLELIPLKLRPVNGKDTSSKLYFMLQLGYFKAKHLFFQFNYPDVENDVKFILNTYMPNDIIPSKLPSRTIQSSTHINILNSVGFRENPEERNKFLLEKSNLVVQSTINPTEVFGVLKNALEKIRWFYHHTQECKI